MPEDLTTDLPSETQRGTTAAITPTSPPGYELLDEVGCGAMGVVYRARDVALGRDVAVKVLADRYGPYSLAAQRFLIEARITGQLQHPGIPAVHQVGALPDGRPFLAMKLIKGSTLGEVLKDRPDRGRLLAVFEAICQAVGYAHAHQVIHRDLKPANVMVGAFGEVQVMDWGLAKLLGAEPPAAGTTEATQEQTRAWTEIRHTLDPGSQTQAGSLVGTPAYVAPEQAVGELAKVNERADVFGLGAILAMMLTGKPPYVGETAESVRVLAVRGKLDDCFARLDACGAEPELVALCKRCLAFEAADRPADAGAVAAAVAALRAAADERARRAELERVRVEGEKATAEARSAERRKRRRIWIGAAAGLAVAVVGGLMAVLMVQQRANADLAAKNRELADEQAKVQAQFDMAVKAIETIHTGVSEDALLKNPQLKELRTHLLKEAAQFYADLEKLLAGQTDARSRKALGAGYAQLAELTFKIGSRPEAVALHRKALAIRRELAAAPGGDLETRLDVARSLWMLGYLLENGMDDYAGALAAVEEQRDLCERLAAEDPSDAIRFFLAKSHDRIGHMLWMTGKPAEALVAHRKALALLQELTSAHPANTEFEFNLARTWNTNGNVLMTTGKPAAALVAFGKALAIWQKLADAHQANTEFQKHRAGSHNNIGLVLSQMGKPAEALAAQRQALSLRQRLADAHPAVIEFQDDLAWCHDQIGYLLLQMGKPAEALAAHGQALAIWQRLVDANPANPSVQRELAWCHSYIGRALARMRRFPEAFTALDTGLALRRKLAEGDPQNLEYVSHLGYSHAYRGGARVRAGQPAAAAADLRRAVELWTKLPHLYTATHHANHSQFELARALALLAGLGQLGGDAQSGVTAAEAATFADQAVAALREAINTGWAQLDELKEPDFDSLRGRADFKKLIAEVEGKVKAAGQ